MPGRRYCPGLAVRAYGHIPYLGRMLRSSLYMILGFVSTVILMAGCGDRSIEAPAGDWAAQYEYFPLSVGQSLTYQVDSVIFDPASGGVARDTSRTFLREMVVDTFLDATGEQTYVIERWERKSHSADWLFKNVCSATRSGRQAVRTEDNLRYMRLVFPMDERSAWNGNAAIDPAQEIQIAGETLRPFAGWVYRVDVIGVPGQAGAFSFDSTLVVTEVDEDNLVEKRFSRAVYAKGVGLVYREQWILDSQYCNLVPLPPDCATKPWVEKAEKGFIVQMKIIEF